TAPGGAARGRPRGRPDLGEPDPRAGRPRARPFRPDRRPRDNEPRGEAAKRDGLGGDAPRRCQHRLPRWTAVTCATRSGLNPRHTRLATRSARSAVRRTFPSSPRSGAVTNSYVRGRLYFTSRERRNSSSSEPPSGPGVCTIACTALPYSSSGRPITHDEITLG